MSLPKLPLRLEAGPYGYSIIAAGGDMIDGVRDRWNSHTGSWPIPDAKQAAERRLAELTRMIEDATPKCPITKGGGEGTWWTNNGYRTICWTTEAERDAVYDALVALWHKENGT